MPPTRITNAISIDLEDWFHPELVRPHVATTRPERRVEWAVEPILQLLQRYQVRATFFVVGDVLRHHPLLLRRIFDGGHEIGCHGWSHRPLWTLAPERFAEELDAFDQDAAMILPLEEIIGFRAPTFSLDERTAWAIDVLRSRGYRYDSSVFPMRNYLYGVDHCPPEPYRPTSEELTTDHTNADFWEFPMTTYRTAGLQIPVSGGFYLRLIPLSLLRYMLRGVNARGYAFALYVHPWEADTQTPRIGSLGLVNRFVTYYNPVSVLRKLEALLQCFRFAPLRDVLGLQGGRHPGGDLR